jgi:hypothetical protein
MNRALFVGATLLTVLLPIIALAVTVQSDLAITVTSSHGGGSSLLPADRNASANWSTAGMLSVGGIPNRTTACPTVSPLDQAGATRAIFRTPSMRVCLDKWSNSQPARLPLRRGVMSLQVTSTSGFSVGQMVKLDEASGAGWQTDCCGRGQIWASSDFRVE